MSSYKFGKDFFQWRISSILSLEYSTPLLLLSFTVIYCFYFIEGCYMATLLFSPICTSVCSNFKYCVLRLHYLLGTCFSHNAVFSALESLQCSALKNGLFFLFAQAQRYAFRGQTCNIIQETHLFPVSCMGLG